MKNLINISTKQLSAVKTKKTFTVIGGGSGGQTMAGHLAILGHNVRLYNRNPEKIEQIKSRGGISLSGKIRGFGKLSLATSNLEEAIDGADIIMVVVPASAHRDVAQACRPYLQDNQMVILHPGRTGGALVFNRYAAGTQENLIIAEAQSLLYACRSLEPGRCFVYGVKKAVPLAAFPGYATANVINALHDTMPQFIPAENVLKTSLDNIGAVFHPTITVLNSARIEGEGDFDFYTQGVTPSTAKILERVDNERVAIASAMGIHALSAHKWLTLAYGVQGKNLYEAIQANLAYKGIKAPGTLAHRYITEDVPVSLVPLINLGAKFSIPTPAMRSLVLMASTLHNKSYLTTGRTIEDMGLAGLTNDEIWQFVMEGETNEENTA